MSFPRTLRAALAVTLSLAIVSCGDDTITAPESRAPGDLNLLHVAPGTPPLVTTQLSFYAVRGRSTGADLYFHASAGQSDSLKLLTFRVGPNALDRRPDGSVIAQGDSVLISVAVVDPYHLVLEFEPSGLKFSETDQPTLAISWAACGDDLNYDGKVDAGDDLVAGTLGIWRQESASLPWYKEAGVILKSTREVAAQIPGFTGYALAF